ncbi:DUF2834 domain-containing protein [Psychroserpens luteolus]|uniref:DUF2834 domain-containing protein n=1 Tax=Psychroserpens luteolus TaxID=2855840 RepID=UPI001E4EAC34|nr:DUF2834 domain-containing protein [Psychroserpens luteolus]MCD2259508.1 DUF2834 domain-containing protein [Psychroserpens luteolus]
MKKVYLALSVLGTILPNIFVVIESYKTQNYLLYTKPLDTFNGMFANNISSAFIIDLLFIVALFLIWSYRESKKYDIKNMIPIWIYTFAFGIAGGLPLFLYFRERKKHIITNNWSKSQ